MKRKDNENTCANESRGTRLNAYNRDEHRDSSAASFFFFAACWLRTADAAKAKTSADADAVYQYRSHEQRAGELPQISSFRIRVRCARGR